MTYRQRLNLLTLAFPRSVTHYPLPSRRRIAHIKRLDPTTAKRRWTTELV